MHTSVSALREVVAQRYTLGICPTAVPRPVLGVQVTTNDDRALEGQEGIKVLSWEWGLGRDICSNQGNFRASDLDRHCSGFQGVGLGGDRSVGEAAMDQNSSTPTRVPDLAPLGTVGAVCPIGLVGRKRE